ncbi:hypothetical protein U9M48_008270 [Paspalum notatum var. saurae]|uniref:Integrase catalytic domain-containing protein n=1 Tax=Paspalum notatum var. saurae TaxID=547442 RepID=A0AAQ3WCX4_PASNO
MEDVWIMDSGCSRHMTGHRKWFSSLNPVSTKEYITFRDNGQGKVMGVGSVSLSAKLSLREVAFVRNLGFNLVSVLQLLDEGFEIRFKKGACCDLDAEETLVCSLLPFDQVFRVDLTSVSGPVRCLVASPSADIWKWHRIFGHLSFDLLVRLSSMGLIRGLPKLRAEKDLVCHPCRHGKMVAASHIPVSQVMTSYPGELLHMDTVGPARVASVSGKWYVLIVVDDFSRFSWVFFMEFKDEAFGFVRDLVLRLRNKSHKAMRAIRSDNGGEFKNSRFENFCRDLGLEHQFSSPYTPPQNGVVECKNRTLIEMARTMLNEHRTPRCFWAEVVNTACYIANWIFLRAFLGKTSYELRFGRQPSVKHLRAFGCRCFVLKKARHLDKFESRCLDGIFLGYASSSRALRVTMKKAQLMMVMQEPLHRLQLLPPLLRAQRMKEDPCPRLPPHSPDSKLIQRLDPLRTQGRLKSFLLKSGFVMGSVDKSMFLLSRGGDTLIVQIYVDDIIFGGSSQALVSSFAEQMSREFEMSLMGELQFFLRLQIKQGLEDGEAVDQKEFRGMIGSLLYLTATRPDIQFAVCLCARYQASPRTSHHQAVKRIFRLQVEGVDNALIKGEIESQWTGLIALLV